MSSLVTEWSVDTKTSASETTSTALNNATLSGTLIVTGAVQLNGGINAPLTIGEDDTGHDVKFFGATSGKYLLWDESENKLKATDSTYIMVGDGNDCYWFHNGTNTFLNNITGDFSIGTNTGTLNIGILNNRPVTIGSATSEVTIGDNLTVTGTLTLGSGAELTEAELELLDGITPGTAAASKALVLDSSKDIGTIRNLTINGEFSDGNYTFDTSGNVTGLGNVTMDGDLTVSGNDIISSSATALTLSGADVEVKGDLTVSGNKITFGNNEIFDNETDGILYVRAPVLGIYAVGYTDSDASIVVHSDTGYDSKIAFYEGASIRWSIGNDGSDDSTNKLHFDYGNAAVAGASKLSLDSSGNLTVAGTVNGRDVATDGTKLDGIEASADVTDVGNVTDAGALMDSEVTNLADVKAFDTSDYATSAQGTLATNALPKAGGELTGAVGFDRILAADATDVEIDFTTGNKAHLDMTGGSISGTLTLKFPATSGNFLLVVEQDGSTRTIASYATKDAAGNAGNNDGGTGGAIRWTGGSVPDLTDGGSKRDVLSFYWDADEEVCYGVGSLNF